MTNCKKKQRLADRETRRFQSFGGMREKAQKNLQTASDQIDEVMGRRIRAIQRTLNGIEITGDEQSLLDLPEINNQDKLNEDKDYEEEQ